ncbi:hypothetical protein Cgig2_016398 [Carnegiea gigantea]|uniref:Aminotransferase-like plant mobile domain-containing protein n=1 Tax=Carnegiea gigantea TaxID=171969 RepID=A0A9Q1K8J0_9CARY|nr:hypothetical protein Cgig2_016398 [Carnegiea gigantea]
MASEVGILLHNLERIGGLPTLGAMYEEFLPPNKDLAKHNKYPTIVIELLRIHVELYKFYNTTFIENIWCTLPTRNKRTLRRRKLRPRKGAILHTSCQEQMLDLNVTTKCEFITFLAFWLSRIVLPHGKEVIRPETFVMAALMAPRQRISLALIVLSYNYYGLGDVASHPNHHGKANAIFPIHYVIGWLAELFPSLYRRRPGSDYLGDFSSLFCYAGLLGSKLSLPQARHIFKDGGYLSLRASSYREDSRNGRDVIDMGLSDKDFKFLLSIWSFVLPVHVGAELLLEPYYPNRLARQFGFDQGVPSNHLSFIRSLR